MIFHDTVTLKLGGGQDDDGRPLPTRDAVYRAEVCPMSAQDLWALGMPVATALYKAVIPPLREGDKVTVRTECEWRGRVYSTAGPAMENVVNGRIRHVELLLKRSTF